MRNHTSAEGSLPLKNLLGSRSGALNGVNGVFYEQVTDVKGLRSLFFLIRVFAFVVSFRIAPRCCSPPGFYTHSDELV